VTIWARLPERPGIVTMTSTRRNTGFGVAVTCSVQINCKLPCEQSKLVEPTFGQPCVKCNCANVLSALHPASSRRCKSASPFARLPTARNDAANAIAMIASATSTSIIVKPRCAP
jgi:hypothetical protein